MEFTQLIKERYSCKKYDGRPVSKELLQEILEAGRTAPTAKNMQVHHIYVIQSEEMLAKMDEATPCRYGAKTMLAIAYDKENVYIYPNGVDTSGPEDVSIVATHMMLAAKNAGVDSCWINRFEPDIVAKALGAPENEKFTLLMDLGYPAEGAGALPNHFSRKGLEETVTFC